MNVDDINIAVRDEECIAIINNKAYKISYMFYSIIAMLKQGICLNDAINNLLCKSEDKQNVEKTFIDFMNYTAKNHSNKSSYIKFKIIIFHKNVAERISSIFQFLFNSNIFFTVFPIAAVINIVFFCLIHYQSDGFNSSFSIVELWILFILSNIFIIFHEIGHASASLRFNLPAKDIGFGFYFIFPVFFTDVTRIWMLSKKERIIVNIAGIYFQLVINVLMIVFFFLTDNELIKRFILYFVFSNIFVATYSFIPFFRNDGYWIYSDLFKIKNLLSESDKLSYNILKGKHIEDLDRNIPLIVFTISNWMFRFYILVKLCVFIFNKFETFNYIQFNIDGAISIVSSLISILGVFMILKLVYRTFVKPLNQINNE